MSKDDDYNSYRDTLREGIDKEPLADFCAAMIVLIIDIEIVALARRTLKNQEDWSDAVSFD